MAMASWMIRGRTSLRSGRSSRSRQDSEDDVQLDFSREASENAREILDSVCRKQGVTEGKRFSYLTAFIKLISKSDIEAGDLGYTTEEIQCCLRVCLVHESTQVRAAALRANRYLLREDRDVRSLCRLQYPALIARSIDVAARSDMERVQALRLARRMLALAPARFPPAVVRALVALANAAADDRDRMLRAALAALAEISVLNCDVFLRCGGAGAVSRNVLSASAPRIVESLCAVLLHLVDAPETRAAAGVRLEALVAPFCDFSCHAPRNREEREAMFSSARLALLSVLRSWGGVLHFCAPRRNSGLRALVAVLHLRQLEVRKAVLELFYDLLNVPLPDWTDEFEVALDAVDPSRPQDAWKLSEGFVAAEGKALLPHLAHCRPSIVECHMALLLCTFLEAGLLDALVDVIVTSDTFISVRATILLGELLHMAHRLLPAAFCAAAAAALPGLVGGAAGAEPAAALARLHARRDRPPAPATLFLDRVMQPAAAAAAKRSSRLQLPLRDVEEALRDSGVLANKDWHAWNWSIIRALLKSRCETVRRPDEFLRRLAAFYRPSSRQFSRVDAAHRGPARLYALAGLDLVDLLLAADDLSTGSKLLTELVADISTHVAAITSSKSAHDCLFSPQGIGNTLCQDYFLFVGRLCQTPRGLKKLDAAGIFQQFLDLVVSTNHDCYVKLIVSSLDYSQPDSVTRVILSKALTGGGESSRLYATNFLLVVLRARPPAAEQWAVELLAAQLYDQSRPVRTAALAALTEAADEKMYLETLIALRPSLLHLGDAGLLLLVKFLGVDAGFTYLSDAGFVGTQLDRWAASFNYRYVRLVEGELHDALTLHRRGEDGRYGRRTSSAPRPRRDVLLPAHLYSALASTPRGHAALVAHEHLRTLTPCIKAALCDTDQRVLELKAALWALANVATSAAGVAFAAADGGLEAMVAVAQRCPVYSLRGTAFYALALVATTRQGANELARIDSTLGGFYIGADDTWSAPLVPTATARKSSTLPSAGVGGDGGSAHGHSRSRSESQPGDTWYPGSNRSSWISMTPPTTEECHQRLDSESSVVSSEDMFFPEQRSRDRAPSISSLSTLGNADASTPRHRTLSSEDREASTSPRRPPSSNATADFTTPSSKAAGISPQRPTPSREDAHVSTTTGRLTSNDDISISRRAAISNEDSEISLRRLTPSREDTEVSTASGRLTSSDDYDATNARRSTMSNEDAAGYATVRSLNRHRRPVQSEARKLTSELLGLNVQRTMHSTGYEFECAVAPTLGGGGPSSASLAGARSFYAGRAALRSSAPGGGSGGGGGGGGNVGNVGVTAQCYMGIALPADIAALFPDEQRVDSVLPPGGRVGAAGDDSGGSECSRESPAKGRRDAFAHAARSCLVCSRDAQTRDRKVSTGSAQHRQRTETECSGVGGGDSPLLFPRRKHSRSTSGVLFAATPGGSYDSSASIDIGSQAGLELDLSRGPLRKELLKHVDRLGNPVWARQARQALLQLKQAFPSIFQDVCVFSDVSGRIASATYRLTARRFVQELFLDLAFEPLYEEPAAILQLSAVRPSTDSPLHPALALATLATLSPSNVARSPGAGASRSPAGSVKNGAEKDGKGRTPSLLDNISEERVGGDVRTQSPLVVRRSEPVPVVASGVKPSPGFVVRSPPAAPPLAAVTEEPPPTLFQLKHAFLFPEAADGGEAEQTGWHRHRSPSVGNDSEVMGESEVKDDSKVREDCVVRDDSKVRGDCVVRDDSRVREDCVVRDDSRVREDCVVRDDSKVRGDCVLAGGSKVMDVSYVMKESTVRKDTQKELDTEHERKETAVVSLSEGVDIIKSAEVRKDTVQRQVGSETDSEAGSVKGIKFEQEFISKITLKEGFILKNACEGVSDADIMTGEENFQSLAVQKTAGKSENICPPDSDRPSILKDDAKVKVDCKDEVLPVVEQKTVTQIPKDVVAVKAESACVSDEVCPRSIAIPMVLPPSGSSSVTLISYRRMLSDGSPAEACKSRGTAAEVEVSKILAGAADRNVDGPFRESSGEMAEKAKATEIAEESRRKKRDSEQLTVEGSKGPDETKEDVSDSVRESEKVAKVTPEESIEFPPSSSESEAVNVRLVDEFAAAQSASAETAATRPISRQEPAVVSPSPAPHAEAKILLPDTEMFRYDRLGAKLAAAAETDGRGVQRKPPIAVTKSTKPGKKSAAIGKKADTAKTQSTAGGEAGKSIPSLPSDRKSGGVAGSRRQKSSSSSESLPQLEDRDDSMAAAAAAGKAGCAKPTPTSRKPASGKSVAVAGKVGKSGAKATGKGGDSKDGLKRSDE